MTKPPLPRRSSSRSSRDPDRTQPVRRVAAGTTTRDGPRRESGVEEEAKPRAGFWRIVRRTLLGLFILGVVGLVGVGYVLAQVPLPTADIPVETTFIYYDDGSELAQLNADGENRVSLELDEISDHLVNAVISTEDKDFFNHSGVDVRAIARATIADIRGQPLQGGSTITQQYAKVTYTDRERSLMRKLREATLAVKLERRFDKEEILERYLNVIYFGRGAYGVQAASKAYFDVNAGDLEPKQAAYLAGLIRAPETADANRPDAPEQAAEADRRRNIVLRAMQEEGHLSEDELEAIAAEPVANYVVPRADAVTDVIRNKEIGTDYFVEYVKDWAMRRDQFGPQVVGAGLHIHTTLNRELQMLAYDAVYGTLEDPAGPVGSLVSIDTQGHVKAMVGGRGFGQGDNSQVNLAIGKDGGGVARSVGSTFKPFVLAELVRQGYSVNSMIDSPAEDKYESTGETFGNYSGGHGRISIAQATRVSSNTAYVTMGRELGIDRVNSTARDLGVRVDLPEVESAPLGSAGVPVIQMAEAYLTFATRGENVGPEVVTRVTDADGIEVGTFSPVRRRVLEENQADIINDVLQDVVSGQGGTGRAAAIGRPLAGKTGTTQDSTDAWFIGYTPGLSTAVWMGNFDSAVKLDTTGGGTPARIFASFMGRAVTDDRYGGSFVKPSSRDGRPFGGADGRPSPPVTGAPSTTEAPTEEAPPTTEEPAPTSSTTSSSTTSSSTPPSTSSTTSPRNNTTTTTEASPPTTEAAGDGDGDGREDAAGDAG